MKILLAFLFRFIVSQQFSELQNCKTKDDKGYEFNLDPLKKSDYWRVRDSSATGESQVFSMEYLFNFCDLPQSKCKGNNVGAYEVLVVLGQMTDTCEVLGRQSNTEIKYIDNNNIDKGIKITYNKGDLCANSEISSQNGYTRKINFHILCDSKQDDNFIQVKSDGHSVTKCNMLFTIKSPVGCVNQSGFFYSLKQLIYYVFYICLIYLIVRIAYNIKVLNMGLVDAIPHKDLLGNVNMPKVQVNQGMLNQILEQLGIMFEFVKQKIQIMMNQNNGNQRQSFTQTKSKQGYSVI